MENLTGTQRKYIKNYDTDQQKGFIYFGNTDFHYIKKITNLTAFQPCEHREHLDKTFDNVIYFWKEKYHILNFDFKNNTVLINGKKFNIIQNYEFTFKKTKGSNILAIGGSEGFFNHVVTSMQTDSAFCLYMFGVLERISKTQPKEINKS